MARRANQTSFQKGQVGNPKGRKPKTPDQRAAEDYLRDTTKAAAERLVELEHSSDEKIALGAVSCHLKLSVGEISRVALGNGGSFLPQLIALKPEHREAVESELERRAK